MRKNEFQIPDRETVTIAKGAGIVFVGTLAGSGLRYLFQIIMARSLGPQLFGVFFLGFVVFRLAGTIAEMGLPSGVVRYVALFQAKGDKRRIKGIIVLALILALLSSLVVASLLVSLSRTLALNLFHQIELVDVLRLFAIAIPFTTLTTIMVFSTQGFKIMKYMVIVREIFEPSSRVLLVSIFFLLGWKLYGAVFAYSFVAVQGTILGYHCLKRTFPQITREELQPIYETKKLLNFSWPLLFVQFFSLTNLWIDTVMLGYFRTSQEVGIYSAAQRTAFLGALLIFSFNTIFAPVISDLYANRRFCELSNYFKAVAKWTFTFNFPLFLIMIFFAESILNIFGSEFVPGATSLIILSIGWLVLSSTGSVSQIITMSGRSKLSLINASSVLVINILLNSLLIPQYGVTGAALATAISVGFGGTIALLEVSVILRIHPYRLNFFKPLIAGCMSFGILFILERYMLRNSNFIFFIALVLIFILVYSYMLFLFGIDEEDRIILERLKRRLFSP